MANKFFPKLFERGQIGTLELPNRIVKAPTFTALAGMDGAITERVLTFYEEVARGGSGLVIVEMTRVDSNRTISPLIWVGDDSTISGLSALAQGIQSHGARAGLQLGTVLDEQMIGGSGASIAKCVSKAAPPEAIHARAGGVVVYEDYTLEDIERIISAFGDAARRTKQAGFDLVELHAAHGHFIPQFLSPLTNKRTDKYGGSPKKRMRFLVEMVQDVREKVGKEYPLSVRLSGTEYMPGGLMIEETLEQAKALGQIGVDVIHVSGGLALKTSAHHVTGPMALPVGNNVWAAEAVKKAVKIPVIASGSITTPELAEEIIKTGKGDFISLARPLFADPYWPQKAGEGRREDIAPCIRCNDGCQERTNNRGLMLMCTVNATVGKEAKLPLIPAKQPRKVAVIGGGPGGMEAARVCALRGHKVTLYEKRKLGGALIEASIPDFKADLRRLIEFHSTQMKKLGVKVVKKAATALDIRNGKFDAVIVATGAILTKPNVPGVDKPIVKNILDVLAGKAKVGQKVLIVGGGIIGVEVGLFLAKRGKDIIFTTRQIQLMSDAVFFDRLAYQEMLNRYKATTYAVRTLKSILDTGAIVVDKDGKEQKIKADSIILAAGFASQTTLRDHLAKVKGLDVYAVGDCINPRRVFDAIHEGYTAAIRI